MGLSALSVMQAAPVALSVTTSASRIEISVKATVDSFVGSLSAYEVAVQVDPQSQVVSSATFAFHFSDVRTGNEKRDKEMLAWEEVGKFPDGRFELTSLSPEGQGKYSAKGQMTLHGQTREVSFPVTIAQSGAGFTIDGDATLDTRQYGLPVIKKFALLKVDPLVVVHFHLVGTAVGR